MAYKIFDDLSSLDSKGESTPTMLSIHGDTVELPDASYARDADMVRDGMDLVLNGPDGSVVIENYFAAEPTPDLVAPGGETLTPHLVNSFAHGQAQYANAGSMTDESPVGAVEEVTGNATVTHLDGSTSTLSQGMPIYQGDVIETASDGAVNIVFIDETSFAVSEDARLSIDEYVFDPDTNAGSTNFSVLKGLFVFTSGLIGREDPDDVHIETPVGSIGIRGTIIMGNINTGEITVVEGAIVLTDFQGHQVTLADQFASAKFVSGESIESMGLLSADDVGNRFASVSKVSATLFSSLNDAATEENVGGTQVAQNDAADEPVEALEENPADAPAQEVAVAETVQPLAPPPGANNFTGQSSGLNANAGHTSATQLNDIRPSGGSTSGKAAAGTIGQNNPLPPGPAPDANQPPPLGVQVQMIGLQENMSTGVVAVLHGQFAQNVNFALNGSANYSLQYVDSKTVNVIYTGAAFDFESVGANSVPGFSFTATSGAGATLSGNVSVPLYNVFDVNPTFTQNESTAYFKASEGSHWVYHFDKDFRDSEGGDILTYSLSGGFPSALLPYLDTSMGGGDGWDFNTSNGKLEMWFKSNFGADPNINPLLTVIATDLGGNTVSSNSTYSFGVENATITSLPGTTGSSNNTYSDIAGISDSMTLTGSAMNNKIFANFGNDQITLTGSANMNYVHGGDGDDMFFINTAGPSNNTLVGGYGRDTYTSNDARNKFFGGDGDDLIIYNNNAMLQLISGTVAGHETDGGWGNDKVVMNTNVDIDFTALRSTYGNVFKNIEIFDLTNTYQQDLALDYNSVFNSTDDRHVLKIERDGNDTVTIDSQSQGVTTNYTTDGDLEVHIGSGVNMVTLLIEPGSGAVTVDGSAV